MDQMTQQNAAMVEQSTAASHSLARDTDTLADLTEHFIPNTQSRQPRPVQTKSTPVKSVKPVPPRSTKQATQGGRTSAALKPAPSVDDWKEFQAHPGRIQIDRRTEVIAILLSNLLLLSTFLCLASIRHGHALMGLSYPSFYPARFVAAGDKSNLSWIDMRDAV